MGMGPWRAILVGAYVVVCGCGAAASGSPVDGASANPEGTSTATALPAPSAPPAAEAGAPVAPSQEAGTDTPDTSTTLPEAACVPQSCLDQSLQCGVATDGCGSVLTCGDCGGDPCVGGVCQPATPPPAADASPNDAGMADEPSPTPEAGPCASPDGMCCAPPTTKCCCSYGPNPYVPDTPTCLDSCTANAPAGWSCWAGLCTP